MKRKTITLEQANTFSKRTTIYLPRRIQLVKPTLEINTHLENLHILEEIIMDRIKYIIFYKEEICPICCSKIPKDIKLLSKNNIIQS